MDDSMYSDNDYYYSDQESLDGFDSNDADLQWASSKGPSCKVITRESLLAAQREDLFRVMDLLSLREHHARTLLIYHRWDVEKLLAVLVEKGKASLFSQSGLSVVERQNFYSPFSSAIQTCIVCMDDISCDHITMMDCGHSFCNDCWTAHFVVKITEGQSKQIRCMAPKCNTICDEAVVRDLVSITHPDLADKFDRFLLESYIEDNKMVKWCPSVPHCGNAIRVENDEFCEVECCCSLQFCFSCSSEAHSPCSCLMWELWAKKCRDESETVNWIMVNTKPCPQCHKPVEKNGGCNLVSCICGQTFCWLCAKATGRHHTWSSITGHSCGRYKENWVKDSVHAKRELYRYMHYHNRYKAHNDSLKLEIKCMEKACEKVSISEERDSSLRDFSWVTDGLNRLSRSRRVLSYSYPFAYYMFGDELFNDEMSAADREIKQNLFEDQQQQLESNVENLSKILSAPFEKYARDELMNMRMEVINSCVVVDTLCKKMYECIENELLGSLQLGTHSIAPYRSEGIEKALELSICLSMKDQNGENHVQSKSDVGGAKEASCSKIGLCSPGRKRARMGVGLLFDLNLPPQAIEPTDI